MKKALVRKKNEKGFTLMEMLIVVAIIAVLVAIMIPAISGSLVKAKEAADVANIRSFYAKQMVEYMDGGDDAKFKSYPKSGGDGYPALNYVDNYKDSQSDGSQYYSYTATKIEFGSGTDNKTLTLTVPSDAEWESSGSESAEG